MAELVATIGLASSIVQLVDFSTKVVKRLDEFNASFGEVPRTFRHIKTELPLITDSLRRIQGQAESGELQEATITALSPVIEECQREVALLEKILDKAVPSPDASQWERRKKAILSLGKDKNVEEIAKSLSKYVRILTLHQAVEGSKTEIRPTNPTSFTLIPFDRNAHFVGREEIFRQIDEKFEVKEGSQPKVALCGLGGIGKSQIALEYCFRRKEKSPECSIFWVHAASVARFEETYKRIATECSLVTGEGTQVDTMQVVKSWLENRHEGPFLLVVDNIDDTDVFFREHTGSGKPISQYIPRTGRGSLLYTTRSRDIAVDLALPAAPIIVPTLTRDEGRRLLYARLGGDYTEDQVSQFLSELEYIPLAITQAAAFMSKRRKTIPQYLELYRKSDSTRLRLLTHEFSDHGRQHNSMESVAKTWTISFESIRKGNPRAADLLSLMSYFDRHAIPSNLLYDEDEDILDFEDAVAVLRAFSLIESDDAETSFDMHRLVQLATKLWLVDERRGEEDRWASEALKSLARRFPSSTYHPRDDHWKNCTSLLPHAQLILKHNFKMPTQETELARATLLLHVADYANWRWDFKEAKIQTEESFNIRKNILTEKHPDTLRCMSQLVSNLRFLEQNEEAVNIGRRLLELRREVLGMDHLETIDSHSDLGRALHDNGQFEEALEMHRTAFETSERVLGREHLFTLDYLGSLALTLDELGEHEEAIEKMSEVVRLKKILGGENPAIFPNLHNLANMLACQERNDEAEVLYRHVFNLEEKMYGIDHPLSFTTLFNLIEVLRDMGKYEEIEDLRRRVFEGPELKLVNDYSIKQDVIDLLDDAFAEANSTDTSSESDGVKAYDSETTDSD